MRKGKSMYKTPWDGWTWFEDYLVDDAGNRYSKDMVRSSIYTSQLQRAITGSPNTILSLKKELQKRVNAKKPSLSIVWNGQKIDIELPD